MVKMRIFLANLGFRYAFYPLATPPMGILYLASYIRQKFDAEIKILNQKVNNISNDALVKNIIDFSADIVGLSTITSSAQHLNYITEKIKNESPKTLIVLGGPHVSSFGSNSISSNKSDIAVLKEGELTFEKIITSFMGDRDFSNIPGIFWRNKNGEIIHNQEPTPIIENLDLLPYPAYDLIDIKEYWKRQSMTPIPFRKYISFSTSRGCPYNCWWCHNIFGKTLRTFSVNRVVDEIIYYKKKYGVNDFEFLDDIFNLNHEWLNSFCTQIINKDLNIKFTFPNALRGDILTKNEIMLLKKAGMYFCSFALETGSPRLQKFTEKNMNIEKLIKNIEYTASIGVFTNGFAILGFPTETPAEVKQTIDTICKSRLHTVSFFTLTPFPNTKIHDFIKTTYPEKLKNISYENVDFVNFKYNFSQTPDRKFFKYQGRANIKFYLNPIRIYRLLKDYPKPFMLILYSYIFFKRIFKRGFSSILL